MKKVGKYIINLKEILGKGRYGSVYKASVIEDKSLEYAVKIFNLNLLVDRDDRRKNLVNEISLMSQLSGEENSDHIVKLYDVKRTSNSIYIFMEYCNEGNLHEYIESKGGRLSEDEAMKVLEDIVKGYKALAKRKIIHRDIKKENILLKDGKWKLADFGLSHILEQDTGNNSEFGVGSPIYMAPQLLYEGTTYTNKCDVWSLGVLLYILLFGERPWNGKTIEELIEDVKERKLSFPEKVQISEDLKFHLGVMLERKEEYRASWEYIFNLFPKQ